MRRCKLFTALSTGGLENKVNRFLEENQDIEIIDLQFDSSFGSVYASIFYRI